MAYPNGTIGAALGKMLFAHMLFDPQCDAILARMIEKDASLEKVFRSRPGDYPEAVMPTLTMSAKDAAAEWLDANCPQHFAREALAG